MLNVLFLEQTPVIEQLKIEEALLRLDTGNWCVLNAGSPPAIVMGISSKPELHLDLKRLQENPIPLIRRYSGGGTVLVEETTLLVSWIFNYASISYAPYPKEVMKWTEPLVQLLFSPIPIKLNENDYVVENKKCGGNAQYFIKNRFVHHSSFVWDYSKERMKHLLLPPKMPDYRMKRAHSDFLYTLKKDFPCFSTLSSQVIARISKLYPCQYHNLRDVAELQKQPHRSSTHLYRLD